MKLRKIIETTIKEFLNENKDNVDQLLDKINKDGKQSLTYDERTYLKQFNDNNINPELEEWIFGDDDSTYDADGNKLFYDEYTNDEDIFSNDEKLKRVISKHLDKNPFTNNADWGGGYVWRLKSNDDFVGTFLYLGDDELVVIKRTLDGDRYDDEEIKYIDDSRGLYNFIRTLYKQ
jgi:hypothetical protein